MKRRPNSAEDEAGQDSFLDIVANIVGILIILVLVAGLRVRNATANAQAGVAVENAIANNSETTAAERELADTRDHLKRLQGDVYDLHREESRLEAAQKDKSRDHVAWTAAVGEMQQRLEASRSQLDERSREQFDLNRQIDNTRDKLRRVAEQHRAASEAPEAIEIEVLPTPLARTVNNRELHFRLVDGQIAYFPFDELLKLINQSVHSQAHKFRQRDMLIDTVGPIDGFSLRYRFERAHHPQSLSGYLRLSHAVILPSGRELTESAAAALSAGSRFRQALASVDRRKANVTLWVYPDSFATYRTVRRYLYDNHWRVATRPLPFGMPIAGWPGGTKSAAQ